MKIFDTNYEIHALPRSSTFNIYDEHRVANRYRPGVLNPLNKAHPPTGNRKEQRLVRLFSFALVRAHEFACLAHCASNRRLVVRAHSHSLFRTRNVFQPAFEFSHTIFTQSRDVGQPPSCQFQALVLW